MLSKITLLPKVHGAHLTGENLPIHCHIHLSGIDVPFAAASVDVYGLRQSSLIIGVHPGCPVCSTVASSLVAVETDVGETISAVKVAFVCGLWSVRVVALLFTGHFSYICFHHLLFPCLEVLVQGASLHHAVGCKVLPVLGFDVKYFYVCLADIPLAQLWAAFESPSSCQLSIKNVLLDAAILHAVDMPLPTQPAHLFMSA